MSRIRITALLVGVCLHIPMSVHAFSDPQAYEDPVDLGGGAGRWFTGSTADGYGCDVCHTGAGGADLTITGLPITGFAASKAYEVSLTWPASAQHLALIAEFTNDQRKGAGTIALPRPESLKPDELCGADLAGELAATVHDADGGRHLVSVIDCGARKLRFQWTAPPAAVEPLWFNVGFVVSNQDATPGGDGVTLVRRPLPAAGQSLPERMIAQGCCAAPGYTRNGFAMLLLLLPLSAARLRRRLRP